MAAEVASQGSQLSNRWQQPISIPIVAVDANQPLTIFLLDPLAISGKANRGAIPASQRNPANTTTGENQSSSKTWQRRKTAYIQALEAQLAKCALRRGRSQMSTSSKFGASVSSAGELRRLLNEHGYVAKPEVAKVMYLALCLGKPLLLEGPPGAGKTQVAKVLSGALGMR